MCFCFLFFVFVFVFTIKMYVQKECSISTKRILSNVNIFEISEATFDSGHQQLLPSAIICATENGLVSFLCTLHRRVNESIFHLFSDSFSFLRFFFKFIRCLYVVDFQKDEMLSCCSLVFKKKLVSCTTLCISFPPSIPTLQKCNNKKS